MSHQFRKLEEAVNRRIASLQGSWPIGFPLQYKTRSTFDALVGYFLPAFPEVTDSQAEDLAVFCRLYAGSVLLHDNVLDSSEHPTEVAATSMRVGIMQYESYRVLHSLFPANSSYWALFQQYLATHSDAFAQEQSFRQGRPLSEFTETLGRTIATGKHSLAKTIVAALVELSGRTELLLPLCQSLDGVATAFQMYDDLEDWRLDFKSGSPSILLSRLTARCRPKAEGNWDDFFRQMAKEIYGYGHAQHVLLIAVNSLKKGRSDKLDSLQLPWTDLSMAVTQRCESMMQKIEQAVARAR